MYFYGITRFTSRLDQWRIFPMFALSCGRHVPATITRKSSRGNKASFAVCFLLRGKFSFCTARDSSVSLGGSHIRFVSVFPSVYFSGRFLLSRSRRFLSNFTFVSFYFIHFFLSPVRMCVLKWSCVANDPSEISTFVR